MAIDLILVGCGNMGYAMLAGWVKAGRISPERVAVVEPNEELRKRAADLGTKVHANSQSLGADIAPKLIMLAVKPQVMRQVVPDYAHFAGPDLVYLSIAAGTPVSTFEELLGAEASIIRCMPNTPASIGQGMMVLFNNPNVSAAQSSFVTDLLSANGAVASIDTEDQMDAVTAVSGSGPAYVFHFIESLTQAARNAGLPENVAQLLAMQTIAGAGALAAASSDTPTRLREQVTSPNGTTAAALGVLMGDDRLGKLVDEAVEAAKNRSIELRG